MIDNCSEQQFSLVYTRIMFSVVKENTIIFVAFLSFEQAKQEKSV